MFDYNTENNKVRIRTSDIPTTWLNARCRNLISKYALIAYRHDGAVIDLRSDKILSKLSHHSRNTDSTELRQIYQQLKMELRLLVTEPELRTALIIMAEKFNYMEASTIH